MNLLMIIDPQNDFVTGSLSVPNCEMSVDNMVELSKLRFDKIITTQDWHPSNHDSFDVNGGPWPVHCVEGTHGAKIVSDTIEWNSDIIFRKGRNPAIDSYSAIRENDGVTLTGLHHIINGFNVDDIYICGLALDYCVKSTIMDIITKCYVKPTLVTDATKAIGDDVEHILDIQNMGCKIITTEQLQKEIR